MYNAWIRGIADNRAAPAEVLLRLLDTGWLDSYGNDRELPAEVVDAILIRGSHRARFGLSRNPFVDPEQRARTVDIQDADPSDPFVRRGLMLGPDRPTPCAGWPSTPTIRTLMSGFWPPTTPHLPRMSPNAWLRTPYAPSAVLRSGTRICRSPEFASC
jgi:hypothetical protein